MIETPDNDVHNVPINVLVIKVRLCTAMRDAVYSKLQVLSETGGCDMAPYCFYNWYIICFPFLYFLASDSSLMTTNYSVL